MVLPQVGRHDAFRRRGSVEPGGGKFPRAVKRINDDQDQLLVYYGFPVGHWTHLRTTSPIKSAFSAVRLRTKATTRGAGSRTAAALATVFKPVECAQQRRRAVNAPHLVASVRAGVRSASGYLVERPEAHAA